MQRKEYKICTKCKKRKLATTDNFYRVRSTGRLYLRCKDCTEKIKLRSISVLRKYDCCHYDKCLSDYCTKNIKFKCENCKSYEYKSIDVMRCLTAYNTFKLSEDCKGLIDG